MELSFVKYLNSLQQFARSERAREVYSSSADTFSISPFQVRSIWTFVL